MDYISAFKQAGLKVHLFTNGTLINEEKASQLVENGLDVLIVSFWAVNPEEHEKCHPGVSVELLRKRIEGLDLLMRAKQKRNRRFPLINLNMPINRHNCMNIEGRMELIRASRCDSVSFGFYRDWGGEFESLCLLPGDIERIRKDLMSARRQLESLGVKHNVEEYLGLLQLDRHVWSQVPCYAGWFQSYLKVDGTVLPCGHCYSEVGNLMEKSFAEIWNGAAFREFRRLGSNSKTLASLGESCDCANCCQMKDNLRVHRLFKWVAPLLPVTAGREIKARQIQ
jgi:radical SAM protein with 4Fe4S-binding SPASM domain